MFYGKEKNKMMPKPTKDNPIWIKNEFIGQPPAGHLSWLDWIVYSTKTGLFTNVKIQAIKTSKIKGEAE